MAGSIHSAVLPFCVPRYSWLKDIWVVSIWSCHEYCALNIHAQVVTSIVVFFCLFIYLFTDWLMQHVYCAVYVWYMCAIMCACIYGYACMCVCWPRACIRCLPLMSLQNFVFSFWGRLSLYAWNSSTGELGYHWALTGFCPCHFVLESHVGHHAWLKIILDLFVYFVHMCFSCMWTRRVSDAQGNKRGH